MQNFTKKANTLLIFFLYSTSIFAQLPCNNWLNTPSEPSYIRIGDLDIAGTHITVEVNFNRTAPENPAGGYGFLVSKHTGPANTNYALWPNGCAITTTGSGHHL
ncbi:MAG TPA: hypothetical protein PK977_17950, partial [Chitinophagaceae bacterium]|nr:hypothetical protein [Chitinophagaceae bacterium]